MPFLIRDDCPCCRKGRDDIEREIDAIEEKYGVGNFDKIIDELGKKVKDRDCFRHCEPCWNRYHNGVRDKDFKPNLAPPYYHSQSEF